MTLMASTSLIGINEEGKHQSVETQRTQKIAKKKSQIENISVISQEVIIDNGLVEYGSQEVISPAEEYQIQQTTKRQGLPEEEIRNTVIAGQKESVNGQSRQVKQKQTVTEDYMDAEFEVEEDIQEEQDDDVHE